MFLYNKQEGVREDSLFCFLLRSIKFEYNPQIRNRPHKMTQRSKR